MGTAASKAQAQRDIQRDSQEYAMQSARNSPVQMRNQQFNSIGLDGIDERGDPGDGGAFGNAEDGGYAGSLRGGQYDDNASYGQQRGEHFGAQQPGYGQQYGNGQQDGQPKDSGTYGAADRALSDNDRKKSGDSRTGGPVPLDVEGNRRGVDHQINPDRGMTLNEAKARDRRLLWRLDLQLIPWLCILYLLSFLDRTNIGNAKIAGLSEDLGMNGTQYNLTLTIFFISYSLFEPVTNVLLKRLRPSVFIPIIMVLWGLVMTFMGFVHNYQGLLAARWFLGITEAGLFPGVAYYLSCWYRRSEFGIRMAIFFSAAAVSGSFGGLLAAAITNMDGIGNKPGWAWIFILEGLFTVVVGVMSFKYVHDFPDNAKFLSDSDAIRVIRRLKADKQSSYRHETFTSLSVGQAFTDYKMYLGMLIYMGCDMPLYAFSLFLPTIVRDMGYASTKAQLLTVPVYAVACVVTVLVGWIADRTNQRGLCNMAVAPIGIIGFALLLGTDSVNVRYGATFLAAIGIYPCISNTITWVSNNIEGVYKRGLVMGMVIGWGNLNGIVSSNIYRTDKDAPRFVPGHSVVLGYMVICLFGGSLALHLLLKRENKLRAAGKRDHWVEGLSQEKIMECGDRRPDFVYTL